MTEWVEARVRVCPKPGWNGAPTGAGGAFGSNRDKVLGEI
jgi:hypothetical protein